MPAVLTESSVLQCVHGGKVVAQPGSRKLNVDKAAVLVRADVLAAVVAGCPLTPKPCTKVTTVTAGLATRLLILKEPVVLATAQGATDLGTWSVLDAGQTKLVAS
ncbi:hypothetical protein [Actinomadura rupiterrae]|uniref:hypothetical protein n=1 Tax=Actinomadura rupiterrae TaxID=559627 RepID=UPI0020A5226C|nr:hypothetical protein [Actinomadura rupiterrae]MCP2341337.1 hypothetical protein [Actinomadura rupiterrae]